MITCYLKRNIFLFLENEVENETESLLIPAVQHDIYNRINAKNTFDLKLTYFLQGT